jgi:hypothetical protein
MKSVPEVLGRVLQQPTPAALLDLQGALLASGQTGPTVERALEIAGQFHAYLCELESKIAARDYSELASRLDMGAVGMVAVENLIAASDEKLFQRLLAGGLGEGLMVAASRQYVKAWQVETGLVHRTAAWYLARVLWQISQEMQPELPDDRRWQTVKSLLAPAHQEDTPAPAKALLLGRIFQLLLLIHVLYLGPRAEGSS